MSSEKKKIREKFRSDVFARDGNKCKMCGVSNQGNHDAHHITDRSLMPGGGYVKENGITLCPPCHEKAEIFHSTGKIVSGWSPTDLYNKIGSNYGLAMEKSRRLLV